MNTLIQPPYRLISAIAVIFLTACQSSNDVPQVFELESGLIPKVVSAATQRHTIDEGLETHNVSGFALGIIEKGRLASAKGYGTARNETPVLANTIFSAGSISKSITGLTTLLLADDGLVDLDTTVSIYLKDWSLPASKFLDKKTISLRHLLNHTGGITPFNSKGLGLKDTFPPLVELLAGGRHSPGVHIDTLAGAQYRYSNLGYGIVQLVIESVTGKPFGEVAKAMILEPLGMNRSTFTESETLFKRPDYACAFKESGNIYEDCWRRSMIPASGGLKSTIEDLTRLLLALSDGLKGKTTGPISPEVAKTIVAQKGYHLGFEIEGEGANLSITNTGRVPGFFAYMRIYPETGNGVTMLCNSDNGGELLKDVLRGASALYGWDIIEPRTIDTITVAPETLETYTGNYLLELGSEKYQIEVLLHDGQLTYVSDGEEYPILPVKEHRFVDLIDGEDLRFVVKNDTVVAVMTNEEYRFERVSPLK